MSARIVATILGVFLVLAPLPVKAAQWTKVADKVERSVVRVNMQRGNGMGTCTGFSINEDKNLYLTAAHCQGEKIFVNRSGALVVYYDRDRDLMVLFAPGVTKPALRLADGRAKLNDDIIAVGFGHGLPKPMFRSGHVSIESLQTPEIGGGKAPYMMTDFAFIGGMSGGPVVNTKGRVVSVVQLGSNTVGLGVTWETVREAIAPYWER